MTAYFTFTVCRCLIARCPADVGENPEQPAEDADGEVEGDVEGSHGLRL
jgi:hypothetical protein